METPWVGGFQDRRGTMGGRGFQVGVGSWVGGFQVGVGRAWSWGVGSRLWSWLAMGRVLIIVGQLTSPWVAVVTTVWVMGECRQEINVKNVELMKLEKYESVMEKEMDALRVEKLSLEQYLNILDLFMENLGISDKMR
ncbi:hypothetical protein SO802_017294 [Lithocarpus litseifolius]|uniref:Uncharacterized protein n=1 Tax=Lithocarpus litseifolius TaxID=425828 RepID=A0AAW2CYW9_9ROSI